MEISFFETEAEEGKESRVRINAFEASEFIVVVCVETMPVIICDPHGVLYTGNYLLAISGNGSGNMGPGLFRFSGTNIGDHAEDLFLVGMKAVIASFIVHPEKDDESYGQSNGQPGDIDAGVEPVLPEIALGGFKVVSQHGGPFDLFRAKKSWLYGYDQIPLLIIP